jgi:hypothetical protein
VLERLGGDLLTICLEGSNAGPQAFYRPLGAFAGLLPQVGEWILHHLRIAHVFNLSETGGTDSSRSLHVQC